MNTFFIICCMSMTVVSVLLGRWLYLRGMRIRNRLLMERVFTNISHELLTPLTVISASVERLRLQEPKYGKDYALMELNIDRMVRLLQQILETSKQQTGELRLFVSQGDVMEYISKSALCIEPLIAQRGLELNIQCSPKSMMGWIDTDKLDKIIYNLISNSAKYTNSPGRIDLIVTTNKNYDHITIKVSDTGIGIPRSKMKHLFHRFQDGEYRSRKTLGTGLGLSLTHDLVYLHGGTITCESKEGEGTTFTVVLPINKEAFLPSQIDEHTPFEIKHPRIDILDLEHLMPVAEEHPVAHAVAVNSTDADCYHILVVEDNLELLMVMRTLLSRKYHVLTAQSGREALAIIGKEPIDLVISDVMMPGMDGNELTKFIKTDPDKSHLPVILLTAKTQEEERRQSMLIGADDYITKPFRLGDLELRINNIVENRKRILRQGGEELQTVVPEKPTPEDEFLRRATECVIKHLNDSEFDRDAFAQEMGASASTLYNKLRAVTGLNITSFIRITRMREARRLAQTQPDLRVSDLAYKVGFKDPKYFATCFKKEFGVQPSEYIEQLNNREHRAVV